MKNRTFSLWKVLVYSFIAYTLIYALPRFLMTTARNYNTDRQIEIFNMDGAILDEFNHVFVNDKLKDYLPYDYKLLEGLYEKLELDPGDTLDNEYSGAH